MILFIGNFLSRHGLNPTAIEDLSDFFFPKYDVKTCSNKKNKILRILDIIRTVFKYRLNCNLIIVDVFSTKAFIFFVVSALMAKVFSIPYIPVLRGGGLPQKYKTYQRLCDFLFTSAEKIISPSIFLQQSIINHKIEIIPNYVDIERFKFSIRKKIEPKLLWVRAIDLIYNPQMAISVIGELKKSYSDIKLYMVGPVKDHSHYKDLKNFIIKNNLESNIKFFGQLNKNKWSEISKECDIFINTTNYDNHPVSVIEAMALGIPIVSTNVGGIPYLLNDSNSILVDSNDINKMCDSIKTIIQKPDFAITLSRNARKQIECEYSKDRVLKKWSVILKKYA